MGADTGLIVKIKYIAFLFSLILFKVHRVQIYARVLLYNVETDGNHRDRIALFLASHSQFRTQEILPPVWGALLHLEWMSSSYSLTIQHSGTPSCVSEDPLSLGWLFI